MQFNTSCLADAVATSLHSHYCCIFVCNSCLTTVSTTSLTEGFSVIPSRLPFLHTRELNPCFSDCQAICVTCVSILINLSTHVLFYSFLSKNSMISSRCYFPVQRLALFQSRFHVVVLSMKHSFISHLTLDFASRCHWS